MDSLGVLNLFIATIAFTALQVKSTPLIAEGLQVSEEEQTQFEDLEADQQAKMATFLALMDKLERATSSRFVSKMTGVRASAKLLGKKNRMEDLHEEHHVPSFHQEESADQIDDLTENNPMRGKHFKKVSQTLPRKGKKRACFWKYCIQNK